MRRHAGGWRPGGLTCGQVRRRIWALIARDVRPAKRTAMLRHMRACDHCFSRAEFARMLQALTRRTFMTGSAPRGLQQDITGRMG